MVANGGAEGARGTFEAIELDMVGGGWRSVIQASLSHCFNGLSSHFRLAHEAGIEAWSRILRISDSRLRGNDGSALLR
jgi:hypothetical protein